MTEDINKRVQQYVQIRDLLKAMDAEHEAKRKPIVELQQILSGRIQQFMVDNKITKGIRTEAGTAYVSTRYTASLADPEAFMKYVIENKDFDLIDRRANATAVKEYVGKHNSLPPGCNLNAIQTVGVRRGKPGEPEA